MFFASTNALWGETFATEKIYTSFSKRLEIQKIYDFKENGTKNFQLF